MRTINKSILVLSLLVTVLSCSDEDNAVNQPVIIQFDENEAVWSENSGAKDISVFLSRASKVNATIIIEVTSPNLDGFTTEPAMVDGTIELPVGVGDSEISFIVSPANNQLMDGDKNISFQITSSSSGFTIGANKTKLAKITDDESPAAVNFMLNLGSTRENNNAGAEVIVTLSHAVPAEGSLTISLSSQQAVYGTHYTTEPAAVNGELVLPISAGEEAVSFKVLPVDDELYNGERALALKIEKAEGAINKGQQLSHDLLITDDELATKAKGYEVVAGAWSYKRNYVYNEDGTLALINWEQRTPGLLEGTYQFEYDNNGNVIKKTINAVEYKQYIWENNRIVKSETYKNDALKEFTLYGYDDAGNVGEVAVHYKQEDGSFPLSLLFVYLYHIDGNVYKRLAYSPIEGSEDYNLLSTQTYEHYLNVENPFSMVEILPNMKTQLTLPLSYRVEENGHDITYDFDYEFDDQGRPTLRRATSSTGSEVADYHYFD